LIASGARLHKRKISQQDRTEKLAKKIAKQNTRRGENLLQQAHSETKSQAEERPVPVAWNSKIQDAAKGKFVVLEVVYSKPKHRGISVAQVLQRYLISSFII
jgi:hypothetical protein